MNVYDLKRRLNTCNPNAEVRIYHKLIGKVLPECIEIPVNAVYERGETEVILAVDENIPCCDSSDPNKCDQCQETGTADPNNH